MTPGQGPHLRTQPGPWFGSMVMFMAGFIITTATQAFQALHQDRERKCTF